MYISRLVKTRDLYPGLLTIAILSPSSPWLLISTSHLISHLSSSIHLPLVYIGGSATTPSHIQKGPSVAIPSVRRL
jgi:hypothetical protein